MAYYYLLCYLYNVYTLYHCEHAPNIIGFLYDEAFLWLKNVDAGPGSGKEKWIGSCFASVVVRAQDNRNIFR